MPFCVNCGKAYDPSHGFCNTCGQQLAQEVIPPSQSKPEDVPQPPPPPPRPASANMPTASAGNNLFSDSRIAEPRFAGLTLLSLVLILCCSSIAFIAADDAYRHKPEYIVFFLTAVLLVALCIRGLHQSWRSTRSIEQQSASPAPLSGKLARRLAFFFAITTLSGGVIGGLVGKSGSETASYLVDIALYRDAGDRISMARNSAARTIADQISMYAKIEPDVQSFKAVVERLKTENRQYDSKYPSAHADTQVFADALVKAGRRGDLLLQQIAVAKQLAKTKSDAVRLMGYRDQMEPLLAQEDQLDGR